MAGGLALLLLAASTLGACGGSSQQNIKIVDVCDLGRKGVGVFTFCPATRRLYVSFNYVDDDLLYEWDVDTGKQTYKYRLGDGYKCDFVAASPDGGHLVVGCWPLGTGGREGKTLIVDTKRDRKMQPLQQKEYERIQPEFSPDGSLFWLCGRDRAYDLAGREVAEARREEGEPAKQSAWRIKPSQDDMSKSGLYYRDANGKDHRLTNNEWGSSYGITSDKRFVVASTWDGDLVVWSTSTLRQVFRRNLMKGPGVCMEYDARENRFLLGDCFPKGTTWLRALVFEEKGKSGSASPAQPAPKEEGKPGARK